MHAKQEKIAVVLPNHVGDLVMATPALRALREARPAAQISAVVRVELCGLLGGSTRIDHVRPHAFYSAPSGWRRLLARVRFARSLRGVDTLIVLTNSWWGALLARLSGAPIRIGYDRRRRSFLLTHSLPAPRENGRFTPVAMEGYYLKLIAALDAPEPAAPLPLNTSLELFTDPESERRCDALFATHGLEAGTPLVCLAPGAGFGPAKIWPTQYVGDLARALIASGAAVALVHGPGESDLAAEVERAAGPGILSLGGDAMDLSLLKSVLARASLLICNDAGARHVAAAFQVRALVLMGPTSLDYTSLNLGETRILREPVGCSPCQQKVCPIDHRCMTRLEPARVIEEAKQALRDPNWRGDGDMEQPGEMHR